MKQPLDYQAREARLYHVRRARWVKLRGITVDWILPAMALALVIVLIFKDGRIL
jgi:energy-coupling factor transporter transmembrane protein EcfT